MALKIRNMRKSDINAVYKMAVKARELQSSSLGRWYPKIALNVWLKSKGDDLLLVAEENRKVVGFLLCYVHYKRWSLLDSMVVDPMHRRKGIATALINGASKRLKKLGVVYAQGLVRTNNSRTLKMMKKLGFNRGYDFYIVDKVFYG
ncbi:MAG: GNAT family N-acetyltransferase [Candidatus Micrarchaeota archaeon]|nr:GNAT family N-acetyltransferase [Candidatus Micrarchaeota archaeon]